jgi:hypothetical protein
VSFWRSTQRGDGSALAELEFILDQTPSMFLAFDAKDGTILLKKQLGDPIGGGIVTYEIDGVAYVAVAGGMNNKVTQQTDSGHAWVAILGLPK